MGLVGGVSHVLDDGGEEEGEGVDGAETSHADQHVDVDFPVLDGLPDIFHVEVVGETAVVGGKTTHDFNAFWLAEKLGSIIFIVSFIS